MEQALNKTTVQSGLIVVPVEEWNETRETIKRISEGLEILKASQPDEFLTVTQVCKALTIGRATFYQYKNNGKLQVCKIGKKLFVKRTDLEAAMEGGNI